MTQPYFNYIILCHDTVTTVLRNELNLSRIHDVRPLRVKRFEQPHTGERIAELLQSILDQWDIPHHKVFHSLTDNGSNMVKAFKLLSTDETDEESSEVLSENELDSEQEDACDDLGLGRCRNV